jgi:hypothetical protein
MRWSPSSRDDTLLPEEPGAPLERGPYENLARKGGRGSWSQQGIFSTVILFIAAGAEERYDRWQGLRA